MAQADKERWDEKYQNNPIPNEPIKLVSDYASLATGPQALDIACGMGRHSKYLASKGFTVDALDISSVAIEHLNNIPNINAIEVDFDTFTLPKEKYDLIVCFWRHFCMMPRMSVYLLILIFFSVKVNLRLLFMTNVNFCITLSFGMKITKDTRQ